MATGDTRVGWLGATFYVADKGKIVDMVNAGLLEWCDGCKEYHPTYDTPNVGGFRSRQNTWKRVQEELNAYRRNDPV